jgi:hypothetical protein
VQRRLARVARVHRVLLLPVAGAIVVLAGCGSSSSSHGCTDVPLAINNEVASSLGTGFTADGFEAVRSRDKKVWFVSARGTDPSGNIVYPTWAVNDLSNSGGLRTVDAMSKNVTPALRQMPGVSADDAAAAKARDCARNGGTGS